MALPGNASYLFGGYGERFHRFLFRPKGDPVHPFDVPAPGYLSAPPSLLRRAMKSLSASSIAGSMGGDS